MGASNSAKQIVIEDSSGGSVVTISESVVRRLKGEQEKFSPALNTESTDSRTENYPETRIPKQTSEEKQKLEDYYLKKLSELEQRNASILKSTTEQFAEAVKEVEKKFMTKTGPQVCQDLQTQVYRCYQANPDHTLECSAVVKEFAACVEKARQNALLRKG